MRNYPDIFGEGEPVVLTEKIHGCQSRLAVIEGEWMAGSRTLRRKRPEDDAFASNTYWFPFTLEPVRALLDRLGQEHRQVILFGEIYGSKIQSLNYGQIGKLGFRAFDLLIDGHYLNWPEFVACCQESGIETVPVVATTPFHLDEVKRSSEGKTLLMQEKPHMREGVVIKPVQERNDPKIGRVVLKYVSDTYLFGDKTDYTDQ